VTQTATVTFTVGAVSAATSTVTATPTTVTADGVASATITITLRDANNNPVAGKAVSLASSRGATDTIVQPAAVTNAAGQTTGTVRSTTAGTSTLTATDTTDTIAITQTAAVTFTAGAAGHFVISASPTTVTAGSPTTITITAHDSNHNIVTTYANPNGLTLSQNGTGSAAQIIWGGAGVTDGGVAGTLAAGNFTNGVAIVTLVDQRAEGPVTITVADPVAGTTGTSNDVAHPPTSNVTWVAGPVSAALSTVTASPTTVTADGVATSTITVTLFDANNNPVGGKTVTLASSRSSIDTISQPSAVTGSNGQTTGMVRSATAGASVISATDATDGIIVTQTATVNFVAPNPPTGLAAMDHPGDAGGAIDLTWTPSASSTATGQRVYRSLASGGPYTLVTTFANNTTASYSDDNGGAGLTNGVTYFYVVRAANSAGVESANSNVASAVPLGPRTLSQAGPDQPATTITSPDLVGRSGVVTLWELETPIGDPNANRTLAAGATFTFILYQQRTGSDGSLVPYAAVYRNTATAPNLICSASGSTPLTSTLTAYTLTCPVGAGGLTLVPSDRLYLVVGVQIGASPTTSSTASLGVEGTPNGPNDSRMVVPWP
jgi:hypothetical protein